jgi:PadR family transcriptional regulator, regulatory protein PadR
MDRSQLIKGALDIAVLAVLAEEESYGYEILVKLAAHGLDDVGDASVYGTLRRLEAAGHLRSRLEPSENGPARRYYSLTTTGRAHLADAAAAWAGVRTALDRLLREAHVRP